MSPHQRDAPRCPRGHRSAPAQVMHSQVSADDGPSCTPEFHLPLACPLRYSAITLASSRLRLQCQGRSWHRAVLRQGCLDCYLQGGVGLAAAVGTPAAWEKHSTAAATCSRWNFLQPASGRARAQTYHLRSCWLLPLWISVKMGQAGSHTRK